MLEILIVILISLKLVFGTILIKEIKKNNVVIIEYIKEEEEESQEEE